jgi:NitT/TauT family transport system substrate-binding protein
MTKRLGSLVLGLALLGAACSNNDNTDQAGTSSGGANAGPVPITVTMTSWVGYGLFHLAVEKGFFADRGVDVKISVVEDEANNPAALESDQFQGDLTTVDTNVRTIAAGVDIVQVMVVDDSNGADGILATGDIQSVNDLAGKSVGVKVGATSYVFLLSVLKDAGMSVSDINVVDMNPGEAGTAFVAGKVDAAVTWEPFLTRGNKRPGGHVLVSSADAPGLIVDSLAIRRDWVTAHPDAVTGLIQGYNDAYEYWKQSPDQALPIMAKSQGVSTDDYKATLPGVTFYGPQEIADFMNAPADQTGIAKLTSYINDFWVAEKVIPAPIEPTKAYDGTYAEKALQGA